VRSNRAHRTAAIPVGTLLPDSQRQTAEAVDLMALATAV